MSYWVLIVDLILTSFINDIVIAVTQLLSPVRLLATPWTEAGRAPPSITISQGFLKFISVELVMPCNHLILRCLFLLLPSIILSISVSYSKSALCIRCQNYWSFSFSISTSDEYSGLISFRIDRFVLLAFQGALKSLLQHHSLKASVLWHSDFLMVQHIPAFLCTLHINLINRVTIYSLVILLS